jgi:hypothetical protein
MTCSRIARLLVLALVPLDDAPELLGDSEPSITGYCAPPSPHRCIRHADCPSDVCDTYAARCLRERDVVYVDRDDAACASGDGTRDKPVCEIGAGIALLGGRSAVRVYPGSYRPFSVSALTVGLYGPAGEGGRAEVTEEDVGGVRIAGGRVLVDGFSIGRHSTFGMSCDSATLRVRRSELLSDLGVGARATGCIFEADRVTFSGLLGALDLQASRYRVTNSVVLGVSERTAIVLDGGSGELLFDTVVGNGDPSLGHPGAIDCRAGARIRDSIIVHNSRDAAGSQLTGACELARVVVGASDTVAHPGAIKLDPMLEGFHLPRNAANLACCIDRARPRLGIRHDFDGQRRPQGFGFDIGADETP